MKKIAIIGGGQAGLLMAFALMEQQYDVNLYIDRQAEELLHGRMMSTTMFFADTLAFERKLGLNFWESKAQYGEAIHVDFRDPQGNIMLPITGFLHNNHGIAMDQRSKYHRWLEEYSQRGGKLILQNVSPEDLAQIAKTHDLTLLAAGKGNITRLFQRNEVRSVHLTPPRKLAAALVVGDDLCGPNSWAGQPKQTLHFNFIAGAGEYFSMPFYSHTHGACRSFLFECIEHGPMDVFDHVSDGEQMLAAMKKAVSIVTPDQSFRMVDNMELSDPNAWLKGAFCPEVRDPVVELADGGLVWGIGDTVMVNDPIAGQGANNATRMVEHYLQAILTHQGDTYSKEWMQEVFEQFWQQSGRYTTEFTNMLLNPPSESLLQVLGAAAQKQVIADDFMGNFNHPQGFWPAVAGAEGAASYLARQEFQDAVA
ncbi:styrene monooxygenase/indole monooxygenase family protein [Acinetobacter rudis]|uniref:styrene monooxygenase/indole monooxygenase family protein n=1 Tax=Acinetobacter rudis TaxID=632955 RepID=UPI00280F22CD|nr:styrene monooxygenase/indole monooxygenase family protein [Acinetobacter rudis]MDQ8952547.1 styrene monooxygenase/indole monooxygenase family protein [Acinetobacter rudis]